MYTIYKHTSPSGKEYIGQTIFTMESRFKGHISTANSGSNFQFHQAIRKYGADNFISEILIDNIESVLEANSIETYYISFYDTYVNGYNMTKLGFGGTSGEAKHLSVLRGVETCRQNGWYDELSTRQSISQNEIQENGKKRSQNIRAEQYKNQLLDIDEDGYNGAQRAAFKYHENLKNTIDEETGLTKAELRIQRQKKTIKEKGLNKGSKNPSHGTKLMSKNNINKKVKKHQVDSYLMDGWVLGSWQKLSKFQNVEDQKS